LQPGRAQTARADVNLFGPAVNRDGGALDIRFPLAIGPYMRMAVPFPKRYAFTADFTFSHTSCPPSLMRILYSIKCSSKGQQEGEKNIL
jgi:hypothetical protein